MRHSNSQYRDQLQYQPSSQARSLLDSDSPSGNAPPGYWYSAEHDAYYAMPRSTSGDKANDGMFLSQRGYEDQGALNERAVTPPPYVSRRGERAQGAAASSVPGDLAGQAMSFLMSAANGRK